MNVSILVSGGGTNLQAIIDAVSHGTVTNCSLVSVISSKPGVYALERAQKAGIRTEVADRSLYPDRKAYSDALLRLLKKYDTELIVLAGFLVILEDEILEEYKDRIINVHPSLIPSFCGDGFYGLKVHEAALERGVKVTGATVHFVNNITDGGRIILQKAVEVSEGDTPEILQRRVMEEAEWEILPKAIDMICNKKI